MQTQKTKAIIMEMTLIPGFRDLFGESEMSYEMLMQDIPTDISICIAIALNAELWNGGVDVQIKMRQKLCVRFSKNQIDKIIEAFVQYTVKTKGYYKIDLMSKRKAPFDKDTDKKLTIYPIICFDDFYFTLPGVNQYLKNIFFNNLSKELNVKYNIRPLTMINLDLLFNLSIRGVTILELEGLIEEYWAILEERNMQLHKNPSVETFLPCHSSFDEVYHSILYKDITRPMPAEPLTEVLKWALISQDQLDEIV